MLTLEHLAELLRRHPNALHAPVRSFSIGPRSFDFDRRPALMGVINLSPDSWYRESVCLSAEAAIRRGRILSAQGADLIDLGAESTLAHAARTDEVTQMARLRSVIETLAAEKILVSVETYSIEVARLALQAGAAVLNWTGNERDEDLFSLAAGSGAAVILCFVQGANPRAVGNLNLVSDPVGGLLRHFEPRVDKARSAGLHRLFLDPGLGFYYRNLQDSVVRIRHQMRVFLEAFRLRELGCPLCQALPHAFEVFQDEVRSAEPFFAVLAALGSTHLFRTHEIPRTRAVLETMGLYLPSQDGRIKGAAAGKSGRAGSKSRRP